MDESGRFEVWGRKPDHPCGFGADFAYGIAGRDYDAVVILDPEPTPEGRYRQVGELHGHWGPRMPKVMYPALRFFNDGFLVGERQVGHFCLDSLWNEYGYRNIYRERNKDQPSHPMALNLGHPRTQDDVMMRRLRQAIIEKRLDLRSGTLIDQLKRCQFYSPKEKTTEDRVGDESLKIKLIGGGSPDLVMALAYALAAVAEMPLHPKPVPRYAPGTWGEIFDHDSFENRGEDTGEVSWITSRKKNGA